MRVWHKIVAVVAIATSMVTPVVAATTLKVATLSPDGSTWMKLMREGAAEVEKKTEGRVQFKLYPGGVMGDDANVLKKIKFGQLHGGALTGGVLASWYRDAQAYNLPFLFANYAEVDAARASFDPQVAAGLEAKGLVLLGMGEGGMAYLMSRKPIKSVEDLQQAKVWIPANDEASRAAVGTLGVSPIPLPLGDVLTGLQTHMIDTIASPPVAAIALQWHSQVKHVLDLPVLFIWGGLVVDKKTFGKLSGPDQAALRSIMSEKFHEMSEINRKDEQGALAALKNQGLVFDTPTGDILKAWHDFGHSATEKVVKDGFISPESYKAVSNAVTELRNKTGAN